MNLKLPIVVSITAIVLILILFQSAALFYVSFNQFEKELRAGAASDLQSLANIHQSVLEYFYSKNEIEEIQKQISSIGSGSNIKLAVFVDDNNRVLASSQLIYKNEVLDYAIFGRDKNRIYTLLTQVKASLGNHLDHSETQNDLLMLQPIVLGSTSSSLRPDRVGLLAIQYDLSWIKSTVVAGLVSQQTPIWLSLIFVLAVLSVAIYWSFIRRIKHISQVALDVSKGDRSQRARVTGADEISFLARFFNSMLDNLQSHQKVLSGALEEISNREQNMTLTLQSIGDAVIVTDDKEKILRMNPVASKLTGWSEIDAIGQPLGNVFKVVDSNSRKVLRNPVAEVMKTGRVIELDDHTSLISKTGREYFISDSAAPITSEDGKTHGVIMVFQDITEEYNLQKALKESEQRLRMALDATEEGLWDWDIKSGNVYYSSRWIKMLGYDSGEILPDISSWKRLIHPDDVVLVMQLLQSHIKGDSNLFEAEHRLQKKDGDYLWVQGRGKVTEVDDAGKALRIVGTISDITEEKEHEEQQRRSQKMEAMGKLTGGIAHDYNNMLGVILGYAELLKMLITDNEKHMMYVESILRAAERGKKLTNSLLKFSRQKETQATAVNINTLIQDDEHMLSRTLTARIKLSLNLDDDLWTVCIDSGDLEDAVLNMTINAMHAMPEGGEFVIVTANEHLSVNEARVMGLEEGEYVCLSLTDNGSGMDEEIVNKIFDPFFTTKQEKGTGLGLSQVYGFMQRSSGGIRVVSQPGKGSQFLLYFPRYYTTQQTEQPDSVQGSRNYSGSETILVVDDEEALRGVADEILSINGYKVLVAADAEAALRVLEMNSVDLLLSDVIMPGMNGYQLAEIVREKYPQVIIQMMSGFNSIDDDLNIEQSLKDNQLGKPFTAIELLGVIRKQLDAHHIHSGAN